MAKAKKIRLVPVNDNRNKINKFGNVTIVEVARAEVVTFNM